MPLSREEIEGLGIDPEEYSNRHVKAGHTSQHSFPMSGFFSPKSDQYEFHMGVAGMHSLGDGGYMKCCK